jgi:hypothetical protein
LDEFIITLPVDPVEEGVPLLIDIAPLVPVTVVPEVIVTEPLAEVPAALPDLILISPVGELVPKPPPVVIVIEPLAEEPTVAPVCI